MRRVAPTVWDKFDPQEYKRERKAASTISSTQTNARTQVELGWWGRARKRLFWSALNGFGAAFWIYAPLKLFVGDVDRWVVTKVSPSLLWLLDYRAFILLTIMSIFLIIFRQWKIVGIFFYIIFYPLVVFLWKIPRLYYRAQSWNLVIGTVQVVWSLGKSVRFTVASITSFTLATLAIKFSGSNAILWGAISVILALWIMLLYRAVKYAIIPSQFMVYQQQILSKILDSDHIWMMTALPQSVKNQAISRLEKSQVDQLVSQATHGLWLYGGSALWAEKLDLYRKSGISVVFSAVSVVTLMAQAVVIFAMVNLGLYRIDESEFVYSGEPGTTTFFRYALSSMFAGEIEAVQPDGAAANLVSVFAGFSCAVIVLVFIVSVIFSLKQGRDDRVAEESIQAMRAKAAVFADKLTGEYSLPLADLIGRVADLGGLVGFWVRQLHLFAGVVQARVCEDDKRS